MSELDNRTEVMKKFQNMLRGQAMNIRDDRVSPVEERVLQMNIVEDLKDYLDHYDEYKMVISAYKRDKEQEEKREQEERIDVENYTDYGL